jgi:site-specific DNA-methyltransferase (adenine-specific)
LGKKQNNLLTNKICCCDVLDGLSSLSDDSADIIIADPPYNHGVDYGNGSSNDRLPMTKYLDWVTSWLYESLRVIKPRGTIYIYGFPEIIARVASQLDLKNHRILAWHYMNKNSPRCFFWQRSHESILVVWKGKQRPIFNVDDVREPYMPSTKPMKRKLTPATKRFGSELTFFTPHEKGAMPRDVVKVNTLAGFVGGKERIIFCKTCNKLIKSSERQTHSPHDVLIHPTQKPLELTERLIKAARPHTKDFTTVILFAGSGSECVATLNQGGNFIAFESNPDFCLLATKYLEAKIK